MGNYWIEEDCGNYWIEEDCDICAVHGQQDDCPNCGLIINEENEEP